MRRTKLRELYGRRFTPWTNVIGALVIVAFGIFLAMTQEQKAEAGEPTRTEEVQHTTDLLC